MNLSGNRPSACQTCRRRRVKCDQAEPSCDRCLKANLRCEGYAKDLKFVDEKGRAQRRVQIKREAYLRAVQADDERLQMAYSHRQQSSVKEPPARVFTEMPMTGFQEQLFMSHMKKYLFAGAKMIAPWVMDYYTTAEDCTSSLAMKSLGSMFYGRKYRHQATLDQSMVYYSKALRLLASDLQHSQRLFEARSLSNVLTLAIFEMMASNNGLGLIGHQSGIARMVEAWKPTRFQGFPENQLLDASRLAILYVHVDQRRKCYLDQQEWLTIPWSRSPEKSLLARLVDRLTHIPRLLEDMESLCMGRHGSQSPEFSQSIYSRVQSELQDLYTWRASWEAETGACCVAKPNKDPHIPFSTTLHFDDLLQAFPIALYDAILLILCRIGRIIVGVNFSPIARSSTSALRTNIALLRPTDPKTVQDVAREILRIAEYSMAEPHTTAGCFQMLFPLRVALEVFSKGSLEWKYLMKCFADIGEKGGYEISRAISMGGLSGRLLQDEYINT